MCAVIGYRSPRPTMEHLNQLKRIFVESKIRGLHAFGFTIARGREISTYKSNNLPELIELIVEHWGFTDFIGHCRYATSGDFNDPENNQPIQIGQSSIVFNGVISMKTKPEMENEYQVKMITDNDGELALSKYIQSEEKAFAWISQASFSFAGMFLDKNQLVAFRNRGRPLHLMLTRDAKFIASTADIFVRSKIEGRRIELEPGLPYVL